MCFYSDPSHKARYGISKMCEPFRFWDQGSSMWGYLASIDSEPGVLHQENWWQKSSPIFISLSELISQSCCVGSTTLLWILRLCDTHSLSWFSMFLELVIFCLFHSINRDSLMNTLHLNQSGYRNEWAGSAASSGSPRSVIMNARGRACPPAKRMSATY